MIDKFSCLLQVPEDRMKYEKHWRHVTVNSAHKFDDLLIEIDMLYMRVEHTVSEIYFIALYRVTQKVNFWKTQQKLKKSKKKKLLTEIEPLQLAF